MRYVKKSTQFQPRENRDPTANNRPSVSTTKRSSAPLIAKCLY